MRLYRYFDSNKKYYIENQGYTNKHEKKEWNKEYLRLPIHELYIKQKDLELEVLMNEKDEESWIYRRDASIKHELATIVLVNEIGIPYLCPEVVLLYKTKNMREKDMSDIRNVYPKMEKQQKEWLMKAIKDNEIKDKIRNLTIAST